MMRVQCWAVTISCMNVAFMFCGHQRVQCSHCAVETQASTAFPWQSASLGDCLVEMLHIPNFLYCFCFVYSSDRTISS